MKINPYQRPQRATTWGTRQMRNPTSGAERYDPNIEQIRTGLNTSEGRAEGGLRSSGPETPAGTVDGVNDTFTLQHEPVSNSQNIYIDGMLQLEGTEYSISGISIIFVTPPSPGDVLVAVYNYYA